MSWRIRVQELADMDLYEVYKPLQDGSEQSLGKFRTMADAVTVCDKANLKEEWRNELLHELQP